MVLVLDRFYVVAMPVERLFVPEVMTTGRIDVVHLDHVAIAEVQSTACAFSQLSAQESPDRRSREGMIAQSLAPVDQVPVER